jgi:hypothetical protein
VSVIVVIILFTEEHGTAPPLFWKNGSSTIGTFVRRPAQRIGFSPAADVSVAGRDLRAIFSIFPPPMAGNVVQRISINLIESGYN